MAMGTEPSPADLAAFAEVMEQIERKNAQRLFYDLFPNEGGSGKEGSVKVRCPNHGGMSTGPKTAEGRRRIAEAQRRRWAAWREEKVRNVGKAAVFGPRNARG